MTMINDPQTSPEESAEYLAAKERAEQVQGLLIHLLVFTVVNASLFAIDALSGGGWWFYWPLLGWGIGLTLHVLVISVPIFSPSWAERRARRQVESHR